jgi:hypothetical protein
MVAIVCNCGGEFVMLLKSVISSATGVLLCVAASGCASQGPKPTDELTKAHTVTEQADKGNAQRYAAADLQRAHDELGAADRANADRKYNDARDLAQRAEADADVAVARGNSGEAQKSAQEIGQSNRTLRQESERNSSGVGSDTGNQNPNNPGDTNSPGPGSRNP